MVKVTVTVINILPLCQHCRTAIQAVEVTITRGEVFSARPKVCQPCANRLITNISTAEAESAEDHEDPSHD